MNAIGLQICATWKCLQCNQPLRVRRTAERLVIWCECGSLTYRAAPFETAIVPVKIIGQLRALLKGLRK
jgi:hypothetical protein